METDLARIIASILVILCGIGAIIAGIALLIGER